MLNKSQMKEYVNLDNRFFELDKKLDRIGININDLTHGFFYELLERIFYLYFPELKEKCGFDVYVWNYNWNEENFDESYKDFLEKMKN